MEIVNVKTSSLCNYEVMTHLQKVKDRKIIGQLATITYETLKYLELSPCTKQSAEIIARCMKQLEPFNLTKNEKLMIVNSPPTTPLEMQLIVEESEERLTESQVETILKIISTHLNVTRPVKGEPGDPEDEDEEANDN